MNTKQEQGACLAVCKRGQALVVAVVNSNDILEVKRHFPWIWAKQGRKARIRKIVANMMADYKISTIVVESNTFVYQCMKDIPIVRPVNLSSAKRLLIPGSEKITHKDLYAHLVNKHPKLRRLVTILPTNRIAVTEKWKTVTLLSIALGLADQLVIRH